MSKNLVVAVGGVSVMSFAADEDGSMIEVVKDGAVVANGYFDRDASDFVIEGKSYDDAAMVAAAYN